MTTIGRHPSGNDIGAGEMLPNHARASNVGTIASNAWLTSFGGRIGRNTGTNATAQFAVFGSAPGTVNDILGVSGTFTVSIYMAGNDNATGSDYTSKANIPVMVGPGAPYGDGSYVALGVRASGASIAHGQDNSGWMMYEDTSITGFADTWTPDNNRPEGKMSLWAEITTNRPPATPSNLSPVKGGRVATPTPTLACDFRDPDEVLPGFTLGQADKVKKYLFEVWNTAKTSRRATSNITNATAAQQTARRVSWTCPTSLSPGSYVARATVYDQFDTPSPVAEWTFAVSAGGAAIPSFAADVVLGTSGNTLVTNSTTPGASVLWQSQDGVAMANLNVRILDTAGFALEALGGNPTPIRGPWFVAKSIANGATGAFTFAEWAAAGGGFAPLPEGTACVIETQGLDVNGILSPWSATNIITINAAPNVPTSILPASGTTVAAYPVLSFTATDATNDASTLGGYIRVRPVGGVEAGSPWDVPYNPVTGRIELGTNASHFPVYGPYEWHGQAFDQWGRYGSFTPWTAINYVAPPVISFSSPSVDEIYPTGTPTFSWTVDRTQTAKLIVVTEVDASGNVTGDGQVRHDYTSPSSITITPTPAAQLHNGRRYRLDLTLTTSDGLVTTVSRTFSIAYPAPSALTTIAASTLAGPFEHATDPSEWSRISVTWDAATTTQVADADFGGYLLRRVNLETQDSIVLAHPLTRDARLFIDRTALSGVAYEYRATYLKRVNTFDMVESVPAVAQASVTLKHSTIVSMDDDDLGCPLRYWTDRSLEWVTDMEVIATWGSKPVIFSGNADSSVLSGSFAVMDDPNGTYTARDVIATVRQIARPRIGDDGYPLPRVVLYRDPKRRLFYAVLTSGGESDEHSSKLGKMDLTFTEIDSSQGVESWV